MLLGSLFFFYNMRSICVLLCLFGAMQFLNANSIDVDIMGGISHSYPAYSNDDENISIQRSGFFNPSIGIRFTFPLFAWKDSFKNFGSIGLQFKQSGYQVEEIGYFDPGSYFVFK